MIVSPANTLIGIFVRFQNFQEQKPLSQLCTFGIGGNASYFVEVRTIAEMQAALEICRTEKLAYFILGKGSNCLFSDHGFNGVVILNKIDFMHDHSNGVFHVGAGYSFSLLGAQTARQGWSGLEFASGIPATVGGAVFMNAGANGAETCNTLISVDFIDATGFLQVLKKENLEFSYRTSPFQYLNGAIVGATFQLTSLPTAREKQLSIIRYRQATQPYGSKSAGCIFRNPNCGYAGALIESCGLKGYSLGGAQVSPLHANFIVNKDKAKAKDVLDLMLHVQTVIESQTGILLESEVRFIDELKT
ncbi:MAG: UDP-N-acetylmuramate dehydrogenase, partial [Parachlamydiaceae bacterium]|nr:UDP-N-acetylmuramate dehydrogenase [Parachlamydiaceae bacterium]